MASSLSNRRRRAVANARLSGYNFSGPHILGDRVASTTRETVNLWCSNPTAFQNGPIVFQSIHDHQRYSRVRRFRIEHVTLPIVTTDGLINGTSLLSVGTNLPVNVESHVTPLGLAANNRLPPELVHVVQNIALLFPQDPHPGAPQSEVLAVWSPAHSDKWIELKTDSIGSYQFYLYETWVAPDGNIRTQGIQQQARSVATMELTFERNL